MVCLGHFVQKTFALTNHLCLGLDKPSTNRRISGIKFYYRSSLIALRSCYRTAQKNFVESIESRNIFDRLFFTYSSTKSYSTKCSAVYRTSWVERQRRTVGNTASSMNYGSWRYVPPRASHTHKFCPASPSTSITARDRTRTSPYLGRPIHPI